VEVCAFSVSTSGARCVLEKSILRDGNVQYECQVSLDHSPLIDYSHILIICLVLPLPNFPISTMFL
jgi:hypothetical protein